MDEVRRQLIVIEKLPNTKDPTESVTLTVKIYVPVAVGVPEMTPPVLIPNPGGRAPESSTHV